MFANQGILFTTILQTKTKQTSKILFYYWLLHLINGRE
jgi:hypothetical protein